MFHCCNQAITKPVDIQGVYKKGNPTLACYNVFNLNIVELVLLNGHFWNFTNASASNKCLLNRGYNNSVLFVSSTCNSVAKKVMAIRSGRGRFSKQS